MSGILLAGVGEGGVDRLQHLQVQTSRVTEVCLCCRDPWRDYQNLSTASEPPGWQIQNSGSDPDS